MTKEKEPVTADASGGTGKSRDNPYSSTGECVEPPKTPNAFVNWRRCFDCVQRRTDLSFSARAVFTVIASAAISRHNPRLAARLRHPGVRAICDAAGIRQRSTAVRAIAELEGAGLVRVRRGGNGQRSEYDLPSEVVAMLETGAEIKPVSEANSRKSGSKNTPVAGVRNAPVSPQSGVPTEPHIDSKIRNRTGRDAAGTAEDARALHRVESPDSSHPEADAARRRFADLDDDDLGLYLRAAESGKFPHNAIRRSRAVSWQAFKAEVGFKEGGGDELDAA